MKIFETVLFALTFVSVICSENVNKRSYSNEQASLNQGEFYQHELVSDDNQGYNDQFGYKHKIKKYYPPESKENVQYMIIKRTHNGPVPKKYVMAQSSTEMTTYHNKQPSKIAYSVVHKPKVMPVKVVQEGSVKHIYLDMPDLFNGVEPKGESSKIPESYDNMKRAPSNNQYQYNAHNPGQYQQNYYRPSIQYAPAPAASGINQEVIGQSFNADFGGYKNGKTNEINPLLQGYGQQNPLLSGYGQHNPLTQEYGQQNPLTQRYGQDNPLTQGYGQQFANEHPNEYEQQFPSEQSNGYGQQFPSEHPNIYGQQFSSEHANGYGSNVYAQEAPYGSQTFGNSGYSSVQTPQFVPSYQNGYSQSQFPQFSADGKERYTYEIPDQYKSLFSNNAYSGNQYGQSQGFSASVPQNQQTYDFGKTASVSKISGFDPNLVNIVNEEVSKGQGYPNSDGFRNVKSSDDKSIYLTGKQGVPSYSFPTNSE